MMKMSKVSDMGVLKKIMNPSMWTKLEKEKEHAVQKPKEQKKTEYYNHWVRKMSS